jgi:DNA adenine methylase
MQANKVTVKTCRAKVTNNGWRPISAPFGYYGSKQRIASRIVATIPPHNAWVDAFCGSASITLAKKPAPIEVVNDLNGEIYNFFRQLRDNSAEMRRLLKLTPYAREELKQARVSDNELSGVERARRFYIAAMMAINGCFGEAEGGFSFSNSYTRRGMEARVSRWNAMPEHLNLVADRLSRVRIENKDAIKLFAEFANRPATLVYLDPPYLAERANGYDNDQKSEAFHEKLLRTATKAKCMVLISGYQNDLYRDYLGPRNGWRKRIMKTTTRSNSGKDLDREEIIWFNEQYYDAAKSGRVPVHLSKKENKQRKVNPTRP